MDLQERREGAGVNNNSLWTNEKHFNFLNRMEAIFVQTMLEKNDASDTFSYSAARLHRYLPDSSDSTQDLKRTRRCTKNSSIHVKNQEGTDANSTDKVDKTDIQRRRRRRSGLVEASQYDQVVPQVGNSRRDKDDENNEADSRFRPT